MLMHFCLPFLLSSPPAECVIYYAISPMRQPFLTFKSRRIFVHKMGGIRLTVAGNNQHKKKPLFCSKQFKDSPAGIE